MTANDIVGLLLFVKLVVSVIFMIVICLVIWERMKTDAD